MKTGDKVIIVEDCREGHPKSGQTATFDGEVLINFADPKTGEIVGKDYNFQFSFPDGSKIMGYECWWIPAHEDLGPEYNQKRLDKFRQFCRDIGYYKDEEHEDDNSTPV